MSWTTVIRPKSRLIDINIRELVHYRDLMWLFVKRDFTVVYKQTILGPLWFVFQPLFTTAIYTIIFGNIARIPTDGIPAILFYLSGIVCWNYFSGCLNKSADTFLTNANIFGKVYFPRLAVPIASLVSNLISLSVQYAFFFAVLIYYVYLGQVRLPRWEIILTPLLILHMAMLGMGVGIWISALTTKYRDLKFLQGFGMQLWMYATPIVYPMSLIPEKWRFLVILNPMAPVTEFFKYAWLGGLPVSVKLYAASVAATLLVFISGLMIFTKVEKSFMDSV